MAALCVFMAAACDFDYRQGRIPNELTVIIVCFGLLFRFCRDGTGGVIAYLGKAFLTMALLYPFFKIGAMGAGDIKLYGVTAGYLPSEKVLLYSFVSLLIAAIISMIKIFRKRNLRERLGILTEYLRGTAESREFRPYPEEKDRKASSVCLSGPALLSLLLCIGGVY